MVDFVSCSIATSGCSSSTSFRNSASRARMPLTFQVTSLSKAGCAITRHMAEDRASGLPTIDVNEYGGKKDGERQKANRRLFMQLLVFELPGETKALVHALEARK